VIGIRRRTIDMMARTNLLGIVLLCTGCHAPPTPAARVPEHNTKWITLADTDHRFRVEYPPTWTADTDVVSVAHYTTVFTALNSAAKAGLIVHELPAGPGELQLNPAVIAQQVPAGTAYIDVGWREGPGPVVEPAGMEMSADNLSLPLRAAEIGTSDDMEMRSIHFWKFGKLWYVNVYLHLPVDAGVRMDLDRILGSFRLE
jgi:hypothetical protein